MIDHSECSTEALLRRVIPSPLWGAFTTLMEQLTSILLVLPPQVPGELLTVVACLGAFHRVVCVCMCSADESPANTINFNVMADSLEHQRSVACQLRQPWFFVALRTLLAHTPTSHPPTHIEHSDD